MSYLRDRLSPPLESVREIEAPVEPWRKALLDAAELIREHGLWKGSDEVRRLKSQCASNAISQVTHCGYHEAHEKFELYLGAKTPGNPGSIFRWNDAPERTEADVIWALNTCARS